MKKLLLIFTLLSLVIFSFSSFAEWTKVSENVSGDEYYINFEEIKKNDGYTYVWSLSNYLEPSSSGDLSSKSYLKIDCNIYGYKNLSAIFYKQPMGIGTADIVDLSQYPKYTNWDYPTTDSVFYVVIKSVCNR